MGPPDRTPLPGRAGGKLARADVSDPPVTGIRRAALKSRELGIHQCSVIVIAFEWDPEANTGLNHGQAHSRCR